jgi:uncharacterized protein (DUF58 family)
MPRPRSAGFRITKVGLSFLVFAFIALLAATNTGNNGLFLVLAVMGATFVVSQILAVFNVSQLAFSVGTPREVFAGHSAYLDLCLENRSHFWARWLLVVTVTPQEPTPQESTAQESTAQKPATEGAKPASATSHQLLVPRLQPRHQHRGRVKIHPSRRGRHAIRNIQVNSLFPLGFFHKMVHHPVDLEFLVFPETFSPNETWPTQAGRNGDAPTRRAGQGHDLLGLRKFRYGDDPRSIHWKHSARTGQLIYKEHQTEESQRLLILFDNATGPLEHTDTQHRFEHMVSEAASAALHHLKQGFEVSLVTRENVLPFTDGSRQRLRILEILALIEPLPRAATSLAPPTDDTAPCLRLTMGAEGAEIAR